MANQISVPVKLEVLKSSIGQMQGILKTLQPDTSGYKNLYKIIQNMTAEAERFEALVSNPFTKDSQFDKADRSIEKMEETLSRAKIALSNIKFSDLKLDDSQLDAFKQIETALEGIEQKFESVKAKAKEQLFSSAENKAAIMGLDPNLIDKDFSTIQKKVDQGVESLNRKLYQAQTRLTEFMVTSTKQQEAAQKLTTEGITPGSIGPELFNRLFQQTATGSLRFSSNYGTAGAAKDEFIKYLTEQFSLSKADMQEIMDRVNGKKGGATANNFNEVLMNMGKSVNNLLTKSTTSASNIGIEKLKADVDQYQQAYDRLKAVKDQMKQMSNESGMVGSASKEYTNAIQQLNQATRQLENDMTKAVRGSQDFANGLSSSQGQLSQFRQAIGDTSAAFLKMEERSRNIGSIKMAITNFMGFYQVLNLIKRGIREATTTIKELDTVMNKISIVTDMSTGDLWDQVDAYSKMAQRYGTSIKGAYEVSQIYYQQGLKQDDVLTLTNETLKLAKISGLDYATTTDYMTTALRGFKMEMSDAANVVDVYSNLAAHTAVTQEELAVAMSKTASSLQSVGSSFEEGSAMIATMVAVTRESATNIGSAMKSIAARYGEMKSDPLKMTDAEGEVMSYNKVDTALKSVGITLKDTNGQFRNFTDVIIELSEKWDTLESTQQRYIATQFAGNRQQSRFLALVSNADLLKENLEYAENAEGTGDVQVGKTLDSIETKINQLKTSYQSFYTSLGAQDAWKGLLGIVKNVFDTFNKIPKIGILPLIYDIVTTIKTSLYRAFEGVTKIWEKLVPEPSAGEQAGIGFGQAIVNKVIETIHQAKASLEAEGAEAANAVADGAKTATQDQMQPASQSKQANQGEKPVQKAAEDVATPAVTNAQTMATAGTTFESATAGAAANVQQIAAASGEAANNLTNAAEQINNASAAAAEQTILTPDSLKAALSTNGLHEQLQEQFQNLEIKPDASASEIQTAITEILAKVQDSSGQLSDIFSQAGTEAVQGYINSLLAGSSAAATAATQISTETAAALQSAVTSNTTSSSTNAPNAQGVIEPKSMGPITNETAKTMLGLMDKAIAKVKIEPEVDKAEVKATVDEAAQEAKPTIPVQLVIDNNGNIGYAPNIPSFEVKGKIGFDQSETEQALGEQLDLLQSTTEGKLKINPEFDKERYSANLAEIQSSADVLNNVFNNQGGTHGGSQYLNSLITQLINAKKISQETGDELRSLAVLGDRAGFATLFDASLNPQGITDQIQELVNKLVEAKSMSEGAGQALMLSLKGASPEELLAKLEELKTQLNGTGNTAEETGNKFAQMGAKMAQGIANASKSGNLGSLGSALNMISSLFDKSSRSGQILSGVIMGIGGLIKIVDGISKAAAASNPWMAIAMGVMAVASAISLIVETDAEKLERLSEEADKANDKAKEAASKYKTLEKQSKKIDELAEKRYESADAADEYQEAVDSLVETFPQLVAGFDEAGNAILDVANKEQILADARKDSAEAAIEAAKKEKELKAEEIKQSKDESRKGFDWTAVGSRLGFNQEDVLSKTRTAFTYADDNGIADWFINTLVDNYSTDGTVADLDKEMVKRFMKTGSAQLNPFKDSYPDMSSEEAYQHIWDTYLPNIKYVMQDWDDEGDYQDLEKWIQLFEEGESAGRRSGGYDIRSSYFPALDLLSIITDNDANRKYAKLASLLFTASDLEMSGDWGNFTENTFKYLNPNMAEGTEYWQMGESMWKDSMLAVAKQKLGEESYSRLQNFMDLKFLNTDWTDNESFSNDQQGVLTQALYNANQALQAGNDYNFNYFYGVLKDVLSLMSPEWIAEHTGFMDAVHALEDARSEVNELESISLAANKRIISESVNLLASSDRTGKYDFVSGSSQLSTLLYQYLAEKDSNQGEYITSAENPELEIKRSESATIDAYAAFYQKLTSRFTKDGKDLLTTFNSMIDDVDNYSDQDIIDFLSDYGIVLDDSTSIVFDAIRTRLDKTSEYLEGLLSKNLEKSLTTHTSSQSLRTLNNYLSGDKGLINTKELTKVETNYFESALGYVSKLTSQGLDSAANIYANSVIDTYQWIDLQDSAIQKSIYDAIGKNGITTREGLSKVIATAKSLGLDTTTLETLQQSILQNLSLSIQTVTSNFVTSWSDESKILKKLTSGLELSEVEQVLTSAKNFNDPDFKLSMDDFIRNGDKLTLTKEAADKYWAAYIKSKNEDFKGMQALLDTSMDTLTGQSDIDWGTVELAKDQKPFVLEEGKQLTDLFNLKNESVKEALTTILSDDLDKYIDIDQATGAWSFKNLDDKTTQEFIKALNDGYNTTRENLDIYEQYLEWAGQQIVKTSQWKAGNYESLTQLGLTSDKYATKDLAYKRVQWLATHMGDMTEEEIAQPEVLNAVKNYQTGYSSLLSDLTKNGLDYVKNHITGYEGIDQAALSAEIDSAGNIVSLTKLWAEQAGKSISETNDAIVAAIKKETKRGSKKSASELMKGGFTLDELKTHVNTYTDKSINDFIDDSGNLVGALADVYHYDADTDSFKKNAEASFEQIIRAYETALGVKINEGSALYQTLLEDFVNEDIKEAERTDTIKKSVSAISSLGKAKVGDKVDITNASQKVKNALSTAGFDVSKNFVDVTSEYALNNAIIAMESLANDPDLTEREQAELQSIINDAKAKMSKAGALSGVIGETVTSDAASAWALSQGTEDVAGEMAKLDYTWNAALKAYVAGADSAVKIEAEIAKLEKENATDPQTIKKLNELKTKAATLKKSDRAKNVNALKDILTNYSSVSDEMIQSLADSLGKSIEEIKQYCTSQADGTYQLDVSRMIADIENGMLTVSETASNLLSQTIQETVTGYIAGLESEVENTTKVGKYSEIKGQAAKIFAEMSQEARESAGLTSIDQLYERDAELGGWKLTDTARDIQIQQEQEQMIAAARRKAQLQDSFTYWATNLNAGTEDYQTTVDRWVKNHPGFNLSAEEIEDITTYAANWKIGTDVEQERARIKQTLSDDLAQINKDYGNIILSSIADFDFDSIASGTDVNPAQTKKDLKRFLLEAGADPQTLTDEYMEEVYNELAESKWNKWDNLFPEGSVYKHDTLLSAAKLREQIKNNYSQYETALDEAYKYGEDQLDGWSEATIALYNQLKGDKTDYSRDQFIKDLNEQMDNMTSIESLEQRQARREKSDKYGITSQSFQTDLYKLVENGQFTLDDFSKLISEHFYDKSLEDYIKDGKWTEEAKNLAPGITKWVYNAQEGVFKIAEASMVDAWQAMGDMFDTSIDTSTDAAQKALQDHAKKYADDLEGKDPDKIISEQIDAFVSSELNNWKTLYSLPVELRDEIASISGILTDEDHYTFKFTTLKAKNEALSKIAEYRDQFDATTKETIDKATLDLEKNKGTAYSALASGVIDLDSAKIVGALNDWDETTTSIYDYMETLGYQWDGLSGNFLFNGDSSKVKSIIAQLKDSSNYTDIWAQAEKLGTVDSLANQYSAFNEILTNVKSVTIDQIGALAESLGISDPNELLKYFNLNDDQTTYELDVPKLLKAGANGKLGSWSKDLPKLLTSQLGAYIDTIASDINEGAKYAFEGVFELQAREDFVKKFKEATGNQNITANDLFSFDSLLNTWTLNLQYLQEYTTAKAKELEENGVSPTDAKHIVEAQTRAVAAQAVDLKEYRDSEYRNDTSSTSYKKLHKQLENYYSQLDKFKQVEIKDGMPSDVQAEMRKYNQERAELMQKQIADDMASIAKGGPEAIKIARQIAAENNIELTPEELQDYFSPIAKRYAAMGEQIAELSVGAFVDTSSDLGKILAGIDGMVDENGVVQSVEKVAQAYKEVYNKLAEEGSNATVAQINTALGKYLDNRDGHDKEGVMQGALESATKMTYSQFAEIYTKMGKQLDEATIDRLLSEGTIKHLSGENMMISNFAKFAEEMGWDPDSDEYRSAFKTYNDSLIDMNRKAETSIKDEITSLTDAKGGDWINLSYLSDALDRIITDTIIPDEEGAEPIEVSALDDLNSVLAAFGANIENGILKIAEDGNILAIVKAISETAETAGLELQEDLAAVKDAIKEVLKSYADAIINGISGGLDNAGKTDLISKAAQLGIKNLRFEETVDGFKLAQKSAIELYNAIKQVDGLQGKIVFDALSDSLQQNNENFATTSALLNHIVTLRTELNAIDSTVPDSRRAEYEAELALAQQIAAVRSTQEDSTMNFMSNKIPAAQNNPLNYAKNWTTALGKIRDAWDTSKVKKNGKAGFIDYTDFYNIVTEMNNIAALGEPIKVGAYTLDGSLEAAAALIEKGANSLEAVDTGDVMVNLGEIGLSLKDGGSDLEAGITEGVEAMANSQVEALDGLIAMLELIVAMEQLGDIAGEDTTIDLGDIFAVGGEAAAADNLALVDGFTSKFEESRKKLIDYLDSNADAKKLFENTKMNIGGESRSMYDMMGLDFDTLFPSTLTGKERESAMKSYQGLLNTLYQAAISGNYNLDDIAGSLQEILNAQDFKFDDSFTLDVGDVTYVVQNGVVVKAADWSDKQAKAVLEQYKKQWGTDDEGTKARLIAAIQNYLNGKGGGEVSVEDIIRIRHSTLIKKDEKGEYIISSKDGKTKYYKNAKDNKGWDAMLAKTALEDQQGLDGQKITIDDKKGTASAEVTYGKKIKVNNEYTKQEKFTVTSDKEGKITWTSEDGKITGSTQQELLENMYNKEHGKEQGTEVDGGEFEKWVYTKYGIHFKIKPVVTKKGEDGVEVVDDPTEDPEVRRAIEDAIAKKDWHTPKDLDNGTVEIELSNGIKVKLNKEDITIDGNFDDKLIQEQLASALGLDLSLGDTITQSITSAFSGENSQAISQTLTAGIAAAFTSEEIPIPEIKVNPSSIDITEGATPTPIPSITVPAEKIIVTGPVEVAPPTASEVPEGEGTVNYKTGEVEELAKQTGEGEVDWSNAYTPPEIDDIYKTVHWKNVEDNPRPKSGGDDSGVVSATGTIGLAKANGTLMGELGPELVVSNGRYFVAGQNGAEFVNLDDDAIVFNHLQTRSLFENGMSKTRGRAITNERNAVAFARGNIAGGPAKSSASAALAALKQLRAQWASLAKLSAKDLAGKGGGGGGGGGNKQFIKDLERWYNWLQRIAQLEKDINFYEAERNRISSEWAPNGHEYYNSQKNSLKALQEELEIQNDLTKEQEAYFKKRRAEMNDNSNPFTSLYTFDENGQLKYKDGAFQKLSEISSRDDTGKPYKSDKEQYEAIIALNSEFADFMKYDSSGKAIDQTDYNAMITAFWDKVDSDKDEMQSLHDDIEDGYKTLEELQESQNELLKEMRDNQMELEEKVYDAIVDMRERAIEELEDTKDAIQDSNDKFITGLTNALQNEQDLYNNADSREELDKLRRKRDILVRSGGSASEIASLNEEIADKEKSVYFDKQQEEIDAIQEASDKQIEKLEAQISLETEILDYQKKYGLLWSEVTEIMSKSPEEIARFISDNDQDYWNKSPVASADALNQLLFASEQWVSYRADGAGLENNVDLIARAVAGDSTDDTEEGTGDDESDTGSDGTSDGGQDNEPQHGTYYTYKYNGTEYKTKTAAQAQKTADFNAAVQAYNQARDSGRTEEAGQLQGTALAIQARTIEAVAHKYATGGLNTYTGLAMLHGTKNKPEAVLNASQTKILRENILGNKPNSLVNLLSSYNDAYKGLSSNAYDSISNNANTTNFNGVELHVDVDSIATPEQARSAAHTMMDEMLRIASKTSANNSVRR